MDTMQAKTYAVGELGRLAEHLAWTAAHPELDRVLTDVQDLTGQPVTDLADRLARAALRAVVWRRALQALAWERAVTAPLGGGSLANEQLYEHAREQAALAWTEWALASGRHAVTFEEVSGA